MTEQLRLGFVGCGRAALVQYIPAVRYLKHGVVAALCDPDPAAVARLARYEPAARQFSDLDEMLASDLVDAVVVLTPTGMHVDSVVKAARAGKHVLCEKPLGNTLAECDEMIAACDAAGVTLMTAFMKRFDKSMLHVKRAIEGGVLGRVHTVTCDWRGRPTPLGVADPGDEIEPARKGNWRLSIGQGGGLLADHGTHTVDLMRWWLGDIVLASGDFDVVGEQSELDNQAAAVFVHDSGARSIHLFGATNERWHESYQIDGTEGTMILSFAPGASHGTTEPFRITRLTNGGAQIFDETLYPHWSMDLELEHNGRYARQIEHFCESVLAGRAPDVTGVDGRKATEAVNAAYLSSYQERKVRLPLAEDIDLTEMFTTIKRDGHPAVAGRTSPRA